MKADFFVVAFFAVALRIILCILRMASLDTPIISVYSKLS